MKRIGLLLILTFVTSICQSQITTPSGTKTNYEDLEVPTIVTTKFNSDHPNTDPIWQMENDDYSAAYKDQNTNLERLIIYDPFGNIVRSDKEINADLFPQAINDYYTKYYPKEEYRIWSSEDNKGNITYFSKRKTGTILRFDKNGNYLSGKSNKTTSRGISGKNNSY